MKKLTNKQKNVLAENGRAFLFYVRENVMLCGGESEEVIERSQSAREPRNTIQAVITALCNVLSIRFTIDGLYRDCYELNFWTNNPLETLLFTVCENGGNKSKIF